MQLDTISVRGLRSLACVEDIPIMQPTVLTGANDSGKSTVLLALAVLLVDAPVPDGARHRGLGADDNVVVEGSFSLHADEQSTLSLPKTVRVRRRVPEHGSRVLEVRRSVPEDERLRDPDARKVDELKALIKESGLTAAGALKQQLVEAVREHAAGGPQVEAWSPAGDLAAHLPILMSFDGTSAPDADAAVLKALSLTYRRHLDDPEIAKMISTIEEKLTDLVEGDAAELCRHIQTRHGDLGEITVAPEISLRGSRGLSGTSLATRAGGEPTRLADTGAGRARRVSLAVWEWTTGALSAGQDRDAVLVYDEPDTHLDYAHQRAIMDSVLRPSSPRVRTVVATHSLNLIDGVDPENLVKLSLDHAAAATTASALRSARHDETDVFLRDVTAALGVRNSVLLNERLFVGVEGETETQAFPLLFRLYTGRSLQSYGIALWSGGNDVGALRFTEYLVKQDRPVAFVVDSDCRTHQKSHFSEKKLRGIGVDPGTQAHYLGAPNEFEELFTDEQWAAVAESIRPRLDGDPWTNKHVAPCRSGKFSSQWGRVVSDQSGLRVSKPTLAFALAESLTTADAIPQALCDAFDGLVALVG